MAWVAVAIGGSALVGAISSSNAAGAQRDASDAANRTAREQYDQNRADTAVARAAGNDAIGKMQDPKYQHNFGMADYQADPGYQFRLDQGQQAIERSAAARGGLNSGGTLKDLTDYAQGSASQEYQNAYNRFNNDNSTTFNRLASLAGTGQTATGQTAANGLATANMIGQNQIGSGNATAAGGMGVAGAVTGAVGTGINTWMGQQMMNKYGLNGTQGTLPTGGGSAPGIAGGYSGFAEQMPASNVDYSNLA